uniref:Uncharacterized protein n=1 Tax=Arundo donax TaxID=35708 RepID=A0A0A9CMX5_ARUDO
MERQRVRARRPAVHLLLLRAQEQAQAQQPRRGRPGVAQHLRPPRHPAQRAEAPRQRRRRRRHRLHLHRHHPPRGAHGQGRHLLLHLRGHPRVP